MVTEEQIRDDEESLGAPVPDDRRNDRGIAAALGMALLLFGSAKSLLRSERMLLEDMRQALKGAHSSAVADISALGGSRSDIYVSGLRVIQLASVSVEAALLTALLRGIREARAAGVRGLPPGPVSGDVQDQIRARAAANALAAAWALAMLRAMTDWNNEQSRFLLTQELQAVRHQIDKALRRTATIENAEAFNASRIVLGKALEARGLIDSWVWNAVLDKHTCATCRARDGKVVKTLAEFNGLPPLHPQCRCSVDVV